MSKIKEAVSNYKIKRKKKKAEKKKFKESDAYKRAESEVPKVKLGGKGAIIGGVVGSAIGAKKFSGKATKGFPAHPKHGTEGFEKGTPGGDATSATPGLNYSSKDTAIMGGLSGILGAEAGFIAETAGKTLIRKYKVKKKAKKYYKESKSKASK